MIVDYLFPSSVTLLKLFFKTYAGNVASAYDLKRVAIQFPIDVAFLGFSFGSAVLYRSKSSPAPENYITIVLTFAVISLIIAFLVSLFCRFAEGHFSGGRALYAFMVCVASYFFAILSVVGSVQLGIHL